MGRYLISLFDCNSYLFPAGGGSRRSVNPEGRPFAGTDENCFVPALRTG